MSKIKLGELSYNTRTEEGEVRIDWDAMPADVVGLDVLSDWIDILQGAYEMRTMQTFRRPKDKSV